MDDFEAKIDQGNRTRLQIEVIKEIPIQGSQQLHDSKIKVYNLQTNQILQNEDSAVQVHMVANRPGSCIFLPKIQFQLVPARGRWTQVYSHYG